MSGEAISPYEQKEEKVPEGPLSSSLSLLNDIKQEYRTLYSEFTVRQKKIVNQTSLAQKINQLDDELKRIQMELKQQDKKNRNYFIVGTILAIVGVVIAIVTLFGKIL